MKHIVGSAAVVLIGLGSLALGCEEQRTAPAPEYAPGHYESAYGYSEQQPSYAYAPPPHRQPPPPPQATTPPVEPVPQAGSLEYNETGENQPPPPPPHAAPAPPPTQPPPGTNVAPPAPPGYGATEAQPVHPYAQGQGPQPGALPPEAHTRTARTVAVATQQIDRLQRLESATGGGRDDVDAALSDLQSLRHRVLADLGELEIEPPTQRFAAQQALDRDVDALRDAVQRSYGILAPPGHSLPTPAPLPPSSQP